MVGEREPRLLEPPPLAEDAAAVEVLRVWARPGDAQQVALKATWEDPGAWGLLLADVARHAANAYAVEGLDRARAPARIRQLLEAELRPSSWIRRMTPGDWADEVRCYVFGVRS